jgi:hypothetical protein
MEPLNDIPPVEEKVESLVSPRNKLRQAREMDAEVEKDVSAIGDRCICELLASSWPGLGLF